MITRRIAVVWRGPPELIKSIKRRATERRRDIAVRLTPILRMRARGRAGCRTSPIVGETRIALHESIAGAIAAKSGINGRNADRNTDRTQHREIDRLRELFEGQGGAA